MPKPGVEGAGDEGGSSVKKRHSFAQKSTTTIGCMEMIENCNTGLRGKKVHRRGRG